MGGWSSRGCRVGGTVPFGWLLAGDRAARAFIGGLIFVNDAGKNVGEMYFELQFSKLAKH